MSEKFDIYEAVTNRMIEQLEQGIIPWNRPWTGVTDGAIKHRTGKPYSLLNQMLLGEQGEYMSFLECKNAGGTIRKGAKSRMVVFFKFIAHTKQDENGEPVRDEDGNIIVKTRPILRYNSVLHVRDCEGVKPKWENEKLHEVEPDALAEAVLADYLKRSGVKMRNVKQNSAYYDQILDEITLPLMKQFDKPGEYYSTAFHEATHSTGAPSRLGRFSITSWEGFGSDSYSREELVAEIGAAAIVHELGIETGSTFKNSAAYLQSWLRALKNDKHLIVSAAGRADKAVRMILNIHDEPAAEEA